MARLELTVDDLKEDRKTNCKSIKIMTIKLSCTILRKKEKKRKKKGDIVMYQSHKHAKITELLYVIEELFDENNYFMHIH